METFFIPTENDFKKWIKEAIKEYMEDSKIKNNSGAKTEEPLLNRKEIANVLRISLVTLTDWMKRGLPCHKQRGRVYFMQSEVLEYIRKNHLRQLKYDSRFSEVG
jgi:predicted DNA-binding transcriptional regulator AlpA